MGRYDRLPDPYASLRQSAPRTGPSVPNMGGFNATPQVTSASRVTPPPTAAAGRPGPTPEKPPPGALLPAAAPAGEADPLAARVTAALGQPRPGAGAAAPAVAAPTVMAPDPNYQAALAAALEKFGHYPGMDDPDHPPPPIVPGALSYNPFAPKGGEWS
jgi:hypothetical protein